MKLNDSNTYNRLRKLITFVRLESLFLLLGIFCFCMAVICLPLSLYNNPVASQSLFELVKFQPMFRYVFLGFLVAGLVFVAMSGHMLLRREEIFPGEAVSAEDRVRIAAGVTKSNEE